ncbi:MAG: hypothetical protein QOG77_837 [Solirubrobacteraceae bacterium]|jgi:hypothetical protein|nr:hypothetical protein [Solirubrobacteraceae bacterium]
MTRFHHTWIVEVELEVTNPEDRAQRIFDHLAAYGCEETEPYPAQVTREDDRWLEVSFPVWAPSQWAAIAAGAAMLSEACARADATVGVVRVGAAESSREHETYRERVRSMETAT